MSEISPSDFNKVLKLIVRLKTYDELVRYDDAQFRLSPWQLRKHVSTGLAIEDAESMHSI
jgi:hypothetical protein